MFAVAAKVTTFLSQSEGAVTSLPQPISRRCHQPASANQKALSPASLSQSEGAVTSLPQPIRRRCHQPASANQKALSPASLSQSEGAVTSLPQPIRRHCHQPASANNTCTRYHCLALTSLCWRSCYIYSTNSHLGFITCLLSINKIQALLTAFYTGVI